MFLSSLLLILHIHHDVSQVKLQNFRWKCYVFAKESQQKQGCTVNLFMHFVETHWCKYLLWLVLRVHCRHFFDPGSGRGSVSAHSDWSETRVLWYKSSAVHTLTEDTVEHHHRYPWMHTHIYTHCGKPDVAIINLCLLSWPFSVIITSSLVFLSHLSWPLYFLASPPPWCFVSLSHSLSVLWLTLPGRWPKIPLSN